MITEKWQSNFGGMKCDHAKFGHKGPKMTQIMFNEKFRHQVVLGMSLN